MGALPHSGAGSLRRLHPVGSLGKAPKAACLVMSTKGDDRNIGERRING